MGAIATLVVVLGIVFVIYGFMERAKAGRVTNAPFLKTGDIRAQAGGSPVSVEGNVVCPQPLIAPFSGTPCLHYSIRCTAEWKAGETNKTKVLSSSQAAAPFSIDDGSGPIGIDATQGGTFEPTQKKSETKGAGLMGSITGKDLTFGQYVVSVGALEVGTKYRVDEEAFPVQPRLYACGAANGTTIGTPAGMRSLILSNKSREALLGGAQKTSKLALAGGFGGIALGTVLGVISRVLAPSAEGAAPAAAAVTPSAELAATPPAAVANAAPPLAATTEPNLAAPIAVQHRLHESTHSEVKPVETSVSIKLAAPPKGKPSATAIAKPK